MRRRIIPTLVLLGTATAVFARMLSYSSHQLTENVRRIDCRKVVRRTVDVSPVRSPQAVHSFIANKIRGSSIVEIGTRNGDGMMCFASAARSASAIEIMDKYCKILEARMHQASRKFNVQCLDFKKARLDADYITWWQQIPITNELVLFTLKQLHDTGEIRPNATALLLFDEKWPGDMSSLNLLEKSPLEMLVSTVDFDEQAACNKYAGDDSRESGFKCYRSFGSFFIGEIQLSNTQTDAFDWLGQLRVRV